MAGLSAFPRGSRLLQAGLAALTIAASVSLCAWRVKSLRLDDPTLGDSAYSDPGEVLVHQLPAQQARVSERLPLACIWPVLLRHRDGWKPWATYCHIGQALLILASGLILHPFAGLLPVTALSLLSLFTGQAHYGYLQSDFGLLVLTTAATLAWRAQAPSNGRSLVLALILGATLLFRSTLIFFPPLLALYERFFLRRRGNARWKQSLILCLVPYLFLLPVVKLNWSLFHRFIPVENGEPDTNIVGAALGATLPMDGNWRHMTADPAVERGGAKTALEWAVGEVIGHPARYLAAYALRFWFVLALHPGLLLLALLGLWVNRWREDIRQLSLLSAYFMAVHCLMIVSKPYFLPLWPVISLLSASLIIPLLPGQPSAHLTPAYRLGRNVVLGCAAAVVLFSLYAAAVVVSYSAKAWSPSALDSALDNAIKEHPLDAWLLAYRGRRRLSRHEAAKAVEDLSRAAALRPARRGWRLDLAWAQLLNGDPSKLFALQFDPEEAYTDNSNFPLHILKTAGHLRFGAAMAARQELKLARRALQPEAPIKTSASGQNRLALERLTSSPEAFVQRADEVLLERAPEERLALFRTLASLYPREAVFERKRQELDRASAHPDRQLMALPPDSPAEPQNPF